MKNVRIAPIKRNTTTAPKIGELCLAAGGLFFWSQKHIDEGYKVGSIQYDVRGVQVVDLAIISEESAFNVGQHVITSNYQVQTISKHFEKSDTYSCKYDKSREYESHQLYKIIALNINSVYERVYNHDENDQFIGTSLKELDVKKIVKRINKKEYAWYLDVKVEGKGEARLENGTVVINNLL